MRTIVNLREIQFDLAFPRLLPSVDDTPVVEYRRLSANGEIYQLRRTTLPNGGVVKTASQFNGFQSPDGRDPMRYGCAWTTVEVIS